MLANILQKVRFLIPTQLLVVPHAFSGSNTKKTQQPRIMKIRRHKMRKFKWRKRVDRDWYQYKKRHSIKKQKSEALFRARMKELQTELEQFDPMEYVKETMAKASKEWQVDAAPTGRRRYPHWSTLMSLEELFGIEKSTNIDKRYGLPSLEDRPLLNKMREEYRRDYIVRDPLELLDKMDEKIAQISRTKESTDFDKGK